MRSVELQQLHVVMQNLQMIHSFSSTVALTAQNDRSVMGKAQPGSGYYRWSCANAPDPSVFVLIRLPRLLLIVCCSVFAHARNVKRRTEA